MALIDKVKALPLYLGGLRPYLRYQIGRHTNRPVITGPYLRTYSWLGPLYVIKDDPEVSRFIREEGVYDISLNLELNRLLTPGLQVVNVGANIGYFAVLAAQRTHTQVLCFEPDHRSFGALVKNAQLYPLLNPFSFAVGDRDGEIAMLLDPVPGNSSLYAADSGTLKTVRMVRLDTFLKSSPDALLMDVQGAELLVLKGADKFLRQIRFIVFEFWPYGLEKTGGTTDELRAILHAHGFQLRHLGRTSLPDPEQRWADLVRRLRATKSGRGFCNLLAYRSGLSLQGNGE